MRPFLTIAIFLSVVISGFFLFGTYATDHYFGSAEEKQLFVVNQKEDAWTLGERLEKQGIVFSRYAFVWHLYYEQKSRGVIAGEYEIPSGLTIPEVVVILTSGKTTFQDIRVTLPEGWTAKQMAERLTANKLPGEAFLTLVQMPLPIWRETFPFLKDLPKNASLEGYLFPDTYFFAREASAEVVVETMLRNFEKKIAALKWQPALRSGYTFHESVTLASIIEEEGRTDDERNMISDVFWKRLTIGQPLQSDATVNYVLGTTRLQPTLKDINTDSPYNTYKYAGLPPGPISSPGSSSLRASFVPTANPYYYFLVSAKTKETIYSVTFEEHVKNRGIHGL